jgi:beta-fructofuranosidase
MQQQRIKHTVNTPANKSRIFWRAPLCGVFALLPPAFAILSLAFYFTPLIVPGQTSESAFTRATAAVEAATPRALADPTHPIFHVASPSQWMNDPNGPIFHKGFYHLFYQLHPFSDGSGPKYWGHVRSRNLVKWEHLPIALCPSADLGEAEIWSGCCTINGRGQPMIFYTSIAPGRSAMDHAEQWAATSDHDLLHWRKSPANPVLSEALHGDRKIYDWRDPFVFHTAGKTFLVTGGNLNQAKGGQAVVNIYQAENPELTKWTYRGIMFQHPDPEARTVECPNFFQLGRKWVLVMSPYGKVQYFIGDFDAATCRFQQLARGVVDFGPNFYAPNTMQLRDGRRLMWGWVTGFPEGRGWNGCLSLPRELSLSHKTDSADTWELKQEPAPELTKLREKPVKWQDLLLSERATVLTLPKTNTLEINANLALQLAKTLSLEFTSGAASATPIKITVQDSELSVMESKTKLQQTQKDLKLRIFFDRSVMEVFVNGTACFTKKITPLGPDPALALRVEGTATAELVEAWPMKTVW